MGCFSVVCNLTKTPIQVGDKVHIVVFDKKSKHWGDETGDLVRSFHSYFCGKYNDYGNIEGEENPKISDLRDKQPLYYFCDDAWKFLDKVLKKEQKIVHKILESVWHLEKAMFTLSKMADDGMSRDDAEKLFKEEKIVKSAEVIKKLCAAWLFAIRNGIQLFQDGFYESYYGQQIHYKEMQEYNKLRKKIVDGIAKEEKKRWEND